MQNKRIGVMLMAAAKENVGCFHSTTGAVQCEYV